MEGKLFTANSDTGENRHICGDSTKIESYQAVMQNELATFMMADPPYCLLTRRNKKTGQKRDPKKAKINHEAITRFENVKAYRAFTRQWLSQAVKFLTEDATLCIWTNFLGKEPIMKELQKLGDYQLLGEFKWCKLTKEANSGNELVGRFYEVGLIFSKQALPSLEPADPPRIWSVVSHYDEEKEGDKYENHPNHKSFSVLEPMIRSYSRPGERILDPFSGSGSTPAAAIKLGRTISGIELRQLWAQVSQKRIAEVSQHA